MFKTRTGLSEFNPQEFAACTARGSQVEENTKNLQ